MTVRLARHSYGKSSVRLTHLARRGKVHDLVQLIAQILLEGEFDAAYIDGDNAKLIPTDSMKNIVYAMARRHGIPSIESFSRRVAEQFLDRYAHVDQADVQIQQHSWARITLDGNPHDHAFIGGGEEQSICRVTADRHGISLMSGLSGLRLLKTGGSGFAGFLKDEFTSLQDTDDRILATTIDATWQCPDLEHDWTATRRTVRDLIIRVFAQRQSPSVQRTLYEMGELVIANSPEIDEIAITIPNQHHLRIDPGAVSVDNRYEIFVPTAEPVGVISATIQRLTPAVP